MITLEFPYKVILGKGLQPRKKLQRDRRLIMQNIFTRWEKSVSFSATGNKKLLIQGSFNSRDGSNDQSCTGSVPDDLRLSNYPCKNKSLKWGVRIRLRFDGIYHVKFKLSGVEITDCQPLFSF